MMTEVMGQCWCGWHGTAVERECKLVSPGSETFTDRVTDMTRRPTLVGPTVPPCASHPRVTMAPTPASKQLAIS